MERRSDITSHPLVFERLRAGWKRMLGEELELAMTSQAKTISYLASPNPSFRRGALSLLAEYWPADPTLESRLGSILSCDADMLVRESAISCLISLHRGNKNPEICRLFASIVLDQGEPQSVRKMAYAGVLAVAGMGLTTPVWRSLKSGNIDTQPEVDWDIVRSAMHV